MTAWRGKAFTPADRKGGFDVESAIGVNGMFNITHNPSPDGRILANIAAFAPLTAQQAARFGVVLLEPESYVRVKDRNQSNKTD